jgi:hypothetical protein
MFKTIFLRKKMFLKLLLVVGMVVGIPLTSVMAQAGPPVGHLNFTVSKGGYTAGIAPSNVLPGSTVTLTNGNQVSCNDSWIVFSNVSQNKIMPDQANVLRIWSTNTANQAHINNQNPPVYGGLTGYLGCTNNLCNVVLCGKHNVNYPWPWSTTTNGWSHRLEIPAQSPLVITNPNVVSTGLWITQCISGGQQKVWRVDANRGRATFLYIENQYDSCGPAGSPSALKFRTANITAGTWITWCSGSGHTRYVWKTNGTQYAPFQYPEYTLDCP